MKNKFFAYAMVVALLASSINWVRLINSASNGGNSSGSGWSSRSGSGSSWGSGSGGHK